MFNLFARSKFCLSAAMVVLLYPWIAATGESLRYSLVLRDIIEARLMRYGGNNKQREATLKQMFAEVGCDDRQQRMPDGVLASQVCWACLGTGYSSPGTPCSYCQRVRASRRKG